MPGRTYTAGSSYRYGFNGKENDNEVKGTGNQMDFGARIYDSRLGRWLSVDPVTHAWQSTYCAMDNNPIAKIDPDGRSTHTDSSGNVILVANDKNKAIYQHKGITTTQQVSDFKSYYEKNGKFNDKGTIMGRTLLWNSFTDDAGRPVGKIDFHSNAGMAWVMSSTLYLMSLKGFDGKPASDEFKLMFYAANAGSFGMFDYKRGGMSEEEFNELSDAEKNSMMWRGSQLSKNLYASARDYGNYMAGVAARLSHQDYRDFLQIAGAFNRNKNNYVGLSIELLMGLHQIRGNAPTYGEAFNSNFFQRFGYNLLKTETQLKTESRKIWNDLNPQ